MRDGAPCTSLVARTSRGGAAALSCPTSRVRLMREDGKRTSRVIAGWGVRAWVRVLTTTRLVGKSVAVGIVDTKLRMQLVGLIG